MARFAGREHLALGKEHTSSNGGAGFIKKPPNLVAIAPSSISSSPTPQLLQLKLYHNTCCPTENLLLRNRHNSLISSKMGIQVPFLAPQPPISCRKNGTTYSMALGYAPAIAL